MAGSDPVRVVITGGPGTGKTTLLEELARRGFAVESEVARAILREPGGMELRAQDPLGFARAMFDAEVSAFARAADRAGPTIYDRGLPDIVGFLRLEGLAVPPDIERACLERATTGRCSAPHHGRRYSVRMRNVSRIGRRLAPATKRWHGHGLISVMRSLTCPTQRWPRGRMP